MRKLLFTEHYIDEENTVDFCTYCGQAIDWSDEE